MPTNKIASRILSALEKSATELENLAKSGKIDARIASKLVMEIDKFSDRFQVAAFGIESFKRHQAKVLKSDPDEKFMATFDNPNKVIQKDSDESFLNKTDASFNSDAIENFDQDRTTTVSDRKEHKVRELNEYAGGTKPQPSWTGGAGGKSTRQGTAKPAKEWA